jgi:predicted small lipoprotein YifL
MKRVLSACIAVALVSSFVGCGDKAEVKKQTTVSTPDGETTTTQQTTVEKSGQNPPPSNP